MNITEATHTQQLLDWLLSLRVWENGADAPSDDDLIEAVRILASRSSDALGAGVGGTMAATRMRAILAGAL